MLMINHARKKWVLWLGIVHALTWGLIMTWVPYSLEDPFGGSAWNAYYRCWGLEFWGHAMLLSAGLATFGMWRRQMDVRTFAFFFFPLQACLAMGVVNAYAVVFGLWDTFPLSRALRSSLPAALLFAFHTAALVEVFWAGLRTRRPV